MSVRVLMDSVDEHKKEETMTGELTLTITSHRSAYEVMQTPQQAYFLVEAMPTALAGTASQAVNLSLVLDRSGSMDGEKMNNLKAAAKAVVDRLSSRDFLSIVIFDETADIVVPGQVVNDREAIKRQIDTIQVRGGTRMSNGMKAGLGELQRGASPDRVSRMLLLTDGQTWEDKKDCEALAVQVRQMGMTLSVMGMGIGDQGQWDPVFLELLAQASGGEWYMIDAPDKATAVFEKTLSTMQGTVLTNASLTLRLASEVLPRNVWRVIPLISRLDHRAVNERDVQVFLGDIQHGIGQSLLVDVLIPARVVGAYRLIHCDITYDVPACNLTGQRMTMDVVVNYTADPAVPRQMNPRMMNIVERVVAHKLQTQALNEAAAGQVHNATVRLRAAATRLLELGEQEMAQTALNQAQQMEQGAAIDPAADQAMRYKTKKLTENLPVEGQNP